MKYRQQLTLILCFMSFCWLGMQAVHELGHVVAAWLTGGEVLAVVLVPWEISRTDIGTNPHPLMVVWAGPVVGVLVPLMLWGIAWLWRLPLLYLFRFFTGFCLVANGIYIAFGPSNTGMDTEVMLTLGSARWMLLLFGIPSIIGGLALWHKQGKHFGFAEAKGVVEKQAVMTAVVLVAVTITVEIIIELI